MISTKGYCSLYGTPPFSLYLVFLGLSKKGVKKHHIDLKSLRPDPLQYLSQETKYNCEIFFDNSLLNYINIYLPNSAVIFRKAV